MASARHNAAKNKLLRQVQKMNAAIEAENAAANRAKEQSIANIKAEMQACAEVLIRLTHERSSIEYQRAHSRREELRRELAHAETELDPATEIARLQAHFDMTKAMHETQRSVLRDEFDAEVQKETVKRSRDPSGHMKHSASWNGDTHARELFLRKPAGLGDDDPTTLELGWTRFDFVPNIPWHSAQAELERIPLGAGGLRDGSEVLSPDEARAILADMRIPKGRSRSTLRLGAAVPSASRSTSSSLKPPRSPLAAAAVHITSRPTLARAQAHPPSLAVREPCVRALSDTILPRTGLRVSGAMLATLTPEMRKKPLHPAYLLPSRAKHGMPWRAPNPSPDLFHVPAHELPPSEAERRKAQKNTLPDRAHYNPAADGKPVWRQTRAEAYPVFSTFMLNDAYAREMQAKEAAELEQRFIAATTDDQEYDGEDAGTVNDALEEEEI